MPVTLRGVPSPVHDFNDVGHSDELAQPQSNQKEEDDP